MTPPTPHVPPGLTPQTATLVSTMQAMQKAWCVVEHHLHDPDTGTASLIWINACMLSEAYLLTDAGFNSEWVRLVKPTSWLYVKVIYTGPREACVNESRRLAMRERPRCNMFGHSLHGIARAIVCSNGVEYATQTEASRALGINQGLLSRHLRHKGVRSIKGLTFVYKDA